MKSIDEFATEYAQDKYMPVQTSQAVKAGANYVLEQIEKAYNKEGLVGVLDLIEQLRKYR